MNPLRYLFLLPSLLWGSVIWLRNRVYDMGWLRSRRASIRTIVVGNLAVGGTGKTPMTCYIASHLHPEYKPAILSRGYGRQTRGFVEASTTSNASELGDEPLLMHRKIPSIPLAVCEDRHRGLQKLAEIHPDLEVVVLDDAFQHRKLLGTLSILLTAYDAPFFEDYVLPFGRLRDNRREASRADVVVVTRCPDGINESEMTKWEQKIRNYAARAPVFFTTLHYGKPIQFWGPPTVLNPGDQVAGFSGIAVPESFRSHLQTNYGLKKFKTFADHHPFTPSDLQSFRHDCLTFDNSLKGWVTTEKDMVKLENVMPASGINEIPLFAIPVEPRFLKNEEQFISIIRDQIKL